MRLLCPLLFCLLTASLHAVLLPYVVDANTVYLWHLDEASGTTAAGGGSAGNTTLIAYDGNPANNNASSAQATVGSLFGAAGFTGFGTAANVSAADYGLGLDANASGGFQLGTNTGASPDQITQASFMGADSAFTIEALINVPAITGTNREIICTDSSLTNRGFQFRINTSGQLEFNFIGTASAAITAALPTTGAHGFVANEWFHVALSHINTGTPSTVLYWTRMSAVATEANVLATNAVETVSGSITGPLVIGNEGRNTAAEGLLGFIDEVRVSNVVRGATQFFFSAADSDSDGLDDAWEINYFSNLAQSGTGDADADGFSNEAEETAGTHPANAAFTPANTDGDGLLDAWEVTHFGNISVTSGSFDPDADFCTNLEEQAAGSNPLSRTDFPDADSDEMADGWEVAFLGGESASPFADADGDGDNNLAEFLANSHPTLLAWKSTQAALQHRWSFNGSLNDSVGTSHATIFDPDGAGNTGLVSQGSNDVMLAGGSSASTDSVRLGTNLLQGRRQPVTLELWATHITLQNWSRIFDFGSSTGEYLMMSWTQASTSGSDMVELRDSALSNAANTNQPYTTGSEFHIIMTLEPGMGAAGSMRVTWYRALRTASGIGAARGSFDTTNTLERFVDAACDLGRSRFTADSVANARYNEVRLWQGALSTTERELYHDLGPDSLTAADTDSDGLLDEWELTFFGSLAAQTASGDPDADGYSNAQEYTNGTNPTVFDSGVTDTDSDGLPDAWENQYFGNLSQNAAGDLDRDGRTHLQEYTDGTIPTDPNSIPGDTDGDNLPDSWELATYGHLAATAYGDSDSDGYTNQAEMLAGTAPTSATQRPAWVSPEVAFMRDTVVATDACLMPAGSTYGRSINGISFQTQPLLTFGSYQYTCYYNTSGTAQKLWLGRRTISGTSVGEWEKFDTGSEFLNGDETAWNAHNVISMGVCPADGSLHFAFDMHGNTLRYRKSIPGLLTTQTAQWGAAALLAEQNWLTSAGSSVTTVTYPMFINRPDGTLVFEYRTGSTSAGDHHLRTYLPATGNWTTALKFQAKEGSYTGVGTGGTVFTSTSRNAYENGFSYGPDGKLHHSWTFRETNAANHDICYAYSPDHGVTWYNSAGTLIADTGLGQAIRVDSPGIIIKVLDSRQRLINQQGQCCDLDGRFHIISLHRRTEADAAWVNGESTFSVLKTAYYHYYRDPITAAWQQRRIPHGVFPVGSRPKIAHDVQGNVYGIYISYASTTANTVPGYAAGTLVIASASKLSQYSDWEIVQAMPTSMNGEPLIDQARLVNDGILSVFIQQDSTTTTVVGTPLHVFDFAVNLSTPVALGAPTPISFMADDTVLSIAGELNKTYQLQTTPNLSTEAWQNVGPVIQGVNGTIALPHADSRTGPHRFWRVVIQ